MTLSEFIQKYPPQAPRRPAANSDENRPLTAADGVIQLEHLPLEVKHHARPRDPNADQAKYLWVFVPTAAPAILELAIISPPLATGRVKHSNLTGGGSASCGGELWVDPVDGSKLYVNGGSGRFGPTTAQQLSDAITVFQSFGYQVVSFGWSSENDLPERVLRDE